MKRSVHICDICNKEVSKGEFFMVKVKTTHFNTRYDFDIARNYRFDICINCYKQFKEWQRDNYPYSILREGSRKTYTT